MIIGLGRLGKSIALPLARHGEAVLIIDANPDGVQALVSHADAAVCADTTDEEMLAALHPERCTCAVVAIGRGAQIRANLTGSERLESSEVLVVIDSREALTALASRA